MRPSTHSTTARTQTVEPDSCGCCYRPSRWSQNDRVCWASAWVAFELLRILLHHISNLLRAQIFRKMDHLGPFLKLCASLGASLVALEASTRPQRMHGQESTQLNAQMWSCTRSWCAFWLNFGVDFAALAGKWIVDPQNIPILHTLRCCAYARVHARTWSARVHLDWPRWAHRAK